MDPHGVPLSRAGGHARTTEVAQATEIFGGDRVRVFAAKGACNSRKSDIPVNATRLDHEDSPPMEQVGSRH
jgi:hypothetical protein